MSTSASTELLMRYGQATRPGGRIFRNSLATVIEFQDAIRKIQDDPHLNAPGKAARIDALVREKGIPALAKGNRQLAHVEKQIALGDKNLKARVVGPHDVLDSERRTVMREASPADRVRMAAEDEAMARAAIRGGQTLSGVTPDVLNRIFDNLAQKFDPAGYETQQTAREGVTFVRASLETLKNAVQKAPAVLASDGSVRPYLPGEFDQVARAVNAPTALSPIEEVEAEAVA
jgi:tellurite resistance protein